MGKRRDSEAGGNSANSGMEQSEVYKNAKRHTRKKLLATANRCEGACNRTGEPSVTFCERGGARERANDFLCKKKVGAK